MEDRSMILSLSFEELIITRIIIPSAQKEDKCGHW